MLSVTAGGSGGARCQSALRTIFVYLTGLILNTPAVQIGANYLGKFNDQGKQAIAAQVTAFVEWISFVKAGNRT